MATTKLDLCIYSLALVGAEPITQTDLDNSANKRAMLCNTFYTVILKDLLRESNWNFSKDTVELSAIVGDVTEGGWLYDFTLPTDYLEAIAIHYTDNGGEVPEGEWEIIEDTLYCNLEEVSLNYIKYVEQPDSWAPDFRRLFQYAFAIELSYPLANSNTRTDRLEAAHEKLMSKVRFNNARENSRKSFKIREFTDARRF